MGLGKGLNGKDDGIESCQLTAAGISIFDWTRDSVDPFEKDCASGVGDDVG